jgi:hypothetical protein
MTDNSETVARFSVGSASYEIDHLGIAFDSQYGEYAAYCGDEQVGSFDTEAAGWNPEHRPPLPDTEALIALARQEVCPCCIEGQRVGMYDTGKPGVCAGCSHLVSEHQPPEWRKTAASTVASALEGS